MAEVLKPRVVRLGYLGEFFRCMAHQPKPLRAFVEFTEFAKAPLDKHIVEIIALTISTRKANSYERNQHERLCVRLGFGREWISQVEALSPESAQLLDNREKQVQRFVLSAIDEHREESQIIFSALVESLGYAQAIAILMVVGRYVAHTVMVTALGIGPPVPSIYEDGFDVTQSPAT